MAIKQHPEPEWSLGEVVSIDLKTDRETVSPTSAFVTVGDEVQIHVEGPDALAIATKIAAVPDLIAALKLAEAAIEAVKAIAQGGSELSDAQLAGLLNGADDAVTAALEKAGAL